MKTPKQISNAPFSLNEPLRVPGGFGLRWQSGAATPLWNGRRRHRPNLALSARKRRGASLPAALQDAVALLAGLLQAFLRRPEMLLFLALTLLFSAPALSGSFSYSMIFQPDAVRAGEWWRLITHPFVHVTRYHLLLDGAAFLLLYNSLIEPKLARRLIFVVAAGVGSLALSWLAAPGIATSGLCGLSAIAHGLMAVSAVEMLVSHPSRSAEWRIGLISLVIVVGKAAIEAMSGHALFGFLYFGLMGDPVAVSHAGGILGSLVAMRLFSPRHRSMGGMA